jgi:hypothetical protein
VDGLTDLLRALGRPGADDRLRALGRPGADDLPEDAAAFLTALGGPCAIRIPGRDHTRVRAVTTLLHGNEPSGLRAIHRWLREERTPAVDALLVVASVEAALVPPGFAHRMLPGRPDLNRCFLGPFDTPEARLAAEILGVLRDARPEAVIDVHNNTGHNPPYGVGVEPTPEALRLTGLFGDRFVWSHLRLGALMEATTDIASVTVEVGRSGDPAADAVAYAGLERFLHQDELFGPHAAAAPRVLVMPMRARLRPGATLEIADSPVPGAHLTIRTDLDRHNFELVAARTTIGWSDWHELPLELVDETGADRAADFFQLSNGLLRTRQPMIPIMITTDAAAAAGDCLFYIVREPDAVRPA